MYTATETQEHSNFGSLEYKSVHSYLLNQSENRKSNSPLRQKALPLEKRELNGALQRKVSESLLCVSDFKPDIPRTWSGSRILLSKPGCRKNNLNGQTSPGRRDQRVFLTSEARAGSGLILFEKRQPAPNRNSKNRYHNENNYRPAKELRDNFVKGSDFSYRFREPTSHGKTFKGFPHPLQVNNQCRETEQIQSNACDGHFVTSDCKTISWRGNGSPKRRLLSKRVAGNCVMNNDRRQFGTTPAPSKEKVPMARTVPGHGCRSPANDIKATTVGHPELKPGQQGNQSNAVDPSVVKRVSKVIEVDGVNYKVTMEPPGSSHYRRNGPCSTSSSKGVPNAGPLFSHQILVNGGQNVNPVETKVDLPNGYPPHDLKSWQEARIRKAEEADLNESVLPDPASLPGLDSASLRLRKLLNNLKRGSEIPTDALRHNLEYAISVMEMNILKNTGSDVTASDDEMPTNLSPVPPEIKSWLVQTFSNSKIGTHSKKGKDRRSLRSVVHVVRASLFVDRMIRKSPSDRNNDIPPQVQMHLKNLDKWTFDIFELEEISNGNSLKYVFYQLLVKFELMKKFKISVSTLLAYCDKLQRGYNKHNNRYHNPIHAADVAQTLNILLMKSGFVNWFSDLEIFSMIMAAIIHDVEHTGTTNNFHINTRSPLAQLYNDKSVLENHHISTAFRMLNEGEGCDILRNFSSEDYQECRALMVEMVLATDMNQHFGQIKRMNQALKKPENLEKSKAMCLMIHTSDINHPTKPWPLHYKWTERLVVEFFEQGDKERELQLQLSPLCDRNSTMVAQSQISFIDYVIKPTFNVLFDLFTKVNGREMRDVIVSMNQQNKEETQNSSGSTANDVLKRRFCDVTSVSSTFENAEQVMGILNENKDTCFLCMDHNLKQWTKKNEIEIANMFLGDDAFTEAAAIVPEPLPAAIYDPPPQNGTNKGNENLPKSNTTTKRTLDSPKKSGPS
ncbi:uncharacterized protein LOC143469028 isoform X1 [Clavelina lepadiformis]|uniref:uncharacterized protein LOC143469028 isoform X1 n=1 Tax=Clavelina lepadiformis TaxID=159417 RepID=UPI0040418DC1